MKLLEGNFNVDFCNPPVVGSVVFGPTFSVEIEDIAGEELVMNFNSTGELVVYVELVDVNGGVLFVENYAIVQGLSEHKISLNSISSGTYFIRINSAFNRIPPKQFIKI